MDSLKNNIFRVGNKIRIARGTDEILKHEGLHGLGEVVGPLTHRTK